MSASAGSAATIRRASSRAAAMWLPIGSGLFSAGASGSVGGKASGAKSASVPVPAVLAKTLSGVAKVPSAVLHEPIRRRSSNHGLAVPA
jgi:hypothetical protein